MKRFYLFLTTALITLTSPNLNSQIVYVDIDAAGAGDGTSWTDAYASLSTALANHTSGEIWVKEGIYIHDNAVADSFNTFLISGRIALYGGFSGTETTAEERDPATNVTILSADYNSDDVSGDFLMNREDNSYHVVTIDSLIEGVVTIDGFTISGGHTGTNTDLSQYNRRGGGIFSYSTFDVNNCVFTMNFANAAAGVFVGPISGGGDGSSIRNSLFEGNLTLSRGAGTYFYGLNDILIENNVFANNITGRGCVYPFTSNNVTIRNNEFSNNTNPYDNGFAAAVFNWNSTNVVIEDCSFTGNTSAFSSAIYIDGRNLEGLEQGSVIRNCDFTDNTATGWGGAIYVWQGDLMMDSCSFNSNTAANGAGFYFDNSQKGDGGLTMLNCDFNGNRTTDFGGGGAYLFGAGAIIENCNFIGGLSANGGGLFMNNALKTINIKNNLFSGASSTFGGGFTVYGDSSIYNLSDNEFSNNLVSESGAGVIIGFGATANLFNNTFSENIANRGGAIYIQQDSTIVDIDSCLFDMNQAEINGGAISMNSGSFVKIANSEITNNGSDNGGGISAQQFLDDQARGQLDIYNTFISFNSASGQGGGINTVGTNVKVQNSVINNNFNLNGISGGGISANSYDSSGLVRVELVNTTIAGNEGELGSGIGLFTGSVENSVDLILRNTILKNEGANIEIEEGTPTVTSMGGNVVSDASLDLGTLGIQDKTEYMGIIFTSYDDFDFHLSDSSPAINIGQGEATMYDIEGSPRVNTPDAGAYEYQLDVSIEETIIENDGQLKILPNPVQYDLTMQLENQWRGSILARIYNINGQLVKSYRFDKMNDVERVVFDVSDLASGVYDLVVGNQKSVVASKMIKAK